MPQINVSYLQAYDFKAWRDRLGYTKGQAAVTLGVSESTYWRMEKMAIGGRVYVWACYGVEAYVASQAVQPATVEVASENKSV